MALVLGLTATLAFWNPTVRLADGKRVSLHGSGPPVLFSSGLFGLMPRRLYTKLFREMRNDLTLVVLDDARPVTEDVLAAVTQALAVDRVGFFSHSSIDTAILDSPLVERAVLCDPVVLPTVSMEGLSAPVVSGAPSLVLRAGTAYDASRTQIPEFITPQFVNGAEVKTYENVGHADVLDDTWADLGPRVLPWMAGASAERVPFAEWTGSTRKGDLASTRAEYRAWIARHVASFLRDGTASPDDVLVEPEDVVPERIAPVGEAEDDVEEA